MSHQRRWLHSHNRVSFVIITSSFRSCLVKNKRKMTSLLPNGLGSPAHAENHPAEDALTTCSQRRGPDSDDVSQALGEKMLQVLKGVGTL